MDVKEIKKELRKELSFLGSESKLTAEIIRDRINKIFDFWNSEKGRVIDAAEKEKVIRELCDEFLG